VTSLPSEYPIVWQWQQKNTGKKTKRGKHTNGPAATVLALPNEADFVIVCGEIVIAVSLLGANAGQHEKDQYNDSR
jgi:hypothetical protein